MEEILKRITKKSGVNFGEPNEMSRIELSAEKLASYLFSQESEIKKLGERIDYHEERIGEISDYQIKEPIPKCSNCNVEIIGSHRCADYPPRTCKEPSPVNQQILGEDISPSGKRFRLWGYKKDGKTYFTREEFINLEPTSQKEFTMTPRRFHDNVNKAIAEGRLIAKEDGSVVAPQKECEHKDGFYFLNGDGRCNRCHEVFNPQKTDWGIKEQAAERFLTGKKNHPDQVWSEMTPEVRVSEALEELADTWNYSEDFKNRKEIRDLLEVIYNMVKANL